MRTKAHRFTALLCAFCMLFTSIPSSVLSDSIAEDTRMAVATPTDLQPAGTEETIPNTDTEPGTETAENNNPEAETTEETVPGKPEADRELEAGDDLTITGELAGDPPQDYLIRFTPDQNQTMVLILTADKELKATIRNENTGDGKTLVKDHTDEDGMITWTVTDYRAEKENTYLLRISAEKPVEFMLRLVRKSIFEQEQAAAEPAEETGDEPTDESAGDTADADPGEAPAGELAEQPGEEPAETPDGQPAGEPADETPVHTETDMPETLETIGDGNADETETEPEPEKSAADREITAGDDVTVSGEMSSSGQYLLRFTPDTDLTLYLILTADDAEATVTDEQTGGTKPFTPDSTVEEEQTVLSVPFYKTKTGNTYLIRISGTGAFTARLVRGSILKAEANRGDEPDQPAEAESDPSKETEEDQAEESAEEPAADPEEVPDEPETEQETVSGTTEESGAKSGQAGEAAPETQAEQAKPKPAQEAETPATKTELEPAKEETPATQTDLEPAEEETPAPQTDPEPIEEEPVEVRIDATDSDIEAYILFLSNAGIPEGMELQVRELTPEEQEAYQAQTAQALNAEDESYLRYTKYLEFTLIHDGWAVPLNAPAKVFVTLPDISEGADALQVVRFDNMAPVLLDSERTENTVSFETEGFDVFGIGNALVPVTDHENELVKVEVLSFSEDAPVNLTEAEAPEVIEGLEVLGTFTIEDNTKATSEDNSPEAQDGLFIKAELKEDAELDPMEGVALYSVDKDGNTDILMEQLTENAKITELEATQVAVIKDTGYRHLTLTVNPDENTEDQIVTLDGMMPKDAEATVADVTELFTDYTYTEIISEGNTDFPEEETAAEVASDTEPAGSEESEEMAEAVEEESEETIQATSEETTGEEPVQTRTTLAAFDISISHSEGEYQPDEDKPISVEIVDSRITANDTIELWHIRDDGIREQITEFTIEEGRIAFEATGFSAYAIVRLDAEPIGDSVWAKVTDLAEFSTKAAGGLYVSSYSNSSGSFFWKNEIIPDCTNKQTGNRSGVAKIKPRVSNPEQANGAGIFYFEHAEGNNYYIYFMNGETKVYLKNLNGNQIFAAGVDDRTAFTVSAEGNSLFSFKAASYNWYINMTNEDAGRGFAAWSANDAGSKMHLWYRVEIDEEPYKLDGKTYGLMRWNGGTAGRALMAESLNDTSVSAETMMILTNRSNHDDMLFVPKDSDITLWTFEWQDADIYRLKDSESGQYLKISSEGVTLTSTADTSCDIKVIPNQGRICLKAASDPSITLVYSGNDSTGFGLSGTTGDEWLHLVDLSDITSDYVVTYTANEVNISDRTQVPDGSRVIIYTRVWDDIHKQYDFYAVDHDGTLVPVYEDGDTIQWVGDRLNTLVWDFVEYCYEGTNTPNGYYELMNEYSKRFLAPQISGQLTSEDAIGIILPGRENRQFYSEILAWDDPYYAFAGIKTNGSETVVPCSRSQAEQFYFAIMEEKTSDQLSTVATVDHTLYGITMKIKDFDTREEMSDFLGNNEGGAVTTLQQNLLSTNLIDGYPTAAGGSLGNFYSGAEEVNHLFLSGTYYGSGYFEYDSTENFASLHGSDFVVYRELGTYDSGGPKNTLKHGQFLPFNDIIPGRFASVNGENLYSALGSELSNTHPRKHEKLYQTVDSNNANSVNNFFAVELSASFVQTPSGHDAWGHDIIYEFTGDDDFWLYVDGELVIDLGGIHSAVSGKINYATGRVEVNGRSTTLYEVFYNNYISRGYSADDARDACDEIFVTNDDGQKVFKEYSAHDIKLFYMERGAGASNLHMRFNLASVKPGQVQLTKKISGSDDIDFNLAKFPFQIYYRINEDDPYTALDKATQTSDNGVEVINVHYANASTIPVDFYPTYNIRTGQNSTETFENVFVIRANETIEITVPDGTISYYIVECAVNDDVYQNVVVTNGDETIEVTAEPTHIPRRTNYIIDPASVDDRRNIIFENVINPDGLRTMTIDKELVRWDPVENQYVLVTDDSTTFKYRIYVSTEDNDDPQLAYLLPYRVKDPDGVYCRRRPPDPNDPNDKGGFVPIDGKTVFTDLTDEEKERATFETSTNGTIAMIPAGYTVEIPNLPVGTYFKLEEKDSDIPDGYRFVEIEDQPDTYYKDDEGSNYISGGIRPNESPSFTVVNKRGWMLKVNKVWTDANVPSVVSTHRDPIYVAIYKKDANDNLVLIPNTVQAINDPSTSTSYYFDTLETDSFDQYVIREVTVNGSTVIPIEEDSPVYYGWQEMQAGESPRSYIVNYEPGTEEDGTLTGETLNVREDTITNTRGGGIIYKLIEYDSDPDAPPKPLKDGVFKLQKYDSSTGTYVDVEAPTYTTGKNGRITILYDFERDTDYVLTQISAPAGYRGITEPVTIRVTHPDATDVVTEQDDNEPGWVTCVPVENTSGNDLIANVTIRNKPFALKAIKVKKNDNPSDPRIPLRGATFALYRQIKSLGGMIKDKNPMTGYAELVTTADGIIPKFNQTLPPGTYYLTEVTPPDYYIGLEEDIILTISELGEISISWQDDGITREDSTDATDPDKDVYSIIIPNEKTDMAPPFLSVEKTVEGKQGDYGKEFTFTLSGLVPTQQYAFIRYVTADGEKWSPANGTGQAESFTADANGSYQFKLTHHQRILFSLAVEGEEAVDKVQVVESAGYDRYTTSYTIDDGEAQQSRNTGEITLQTDTVEVKYTNTMNSISPTGISMRGTPYLLILIVGIIMIFMTGACTIRRKRSETPIREQRHMDVQIRRQGNPKTPACPRAVLWQNIPGIKHRGRTKTPEI